MSLVDTPCKRPRELASVAANRMDASCSTSPRAPPKKSQPSAESPLKEHAPAAAQPESWHPRAAWPAGAPESVWHRPMVTDAADLRMLLTNRRDDTTIVFIALAPWCIDRWQSCLAAGAELARDAAVESYLVDVDALEEATELLHITTAQLPSAHSFHQDASAPVDATMSVKRAQKAVTSRIDIVSLLCFQPVFGLAHLHRRLERSAASAASNGKTSFVVCYSGAVWCPPCCRIMPQVPAMVRELCDDLASKGIVVETLKADRDTSGTVDLVYEVKLIPTFQVFRASDAAAAFVSGDAALTSLPAVAPEPSADDDGAASAWDGRITAARAVAVKPLAQLQNSQRPNVMAFLERHCAPLTFDDDDF
jgi:thiol-disulfide isomerase/thioredoxin